MVPMAGGCVGWCAGQLDGDECGCGAWGLFGLEGTIEFRLSVKTFQMSKASEIMRHKTQRTIQGNVLLAFEHIRLQIGSI